MSAPFKVMSAAGKQIYNNLPEVYRTRDQGDLAKLVDACGAFLDLVRATLDQRLADCFPDNPPHGLSCQPWLIPYFAQLVDVRLVSPDERGRREEVSNAVAWRQRKGTLKAIEQIAQAVGQMEVEFQEGWQRTAITPRIGMPLLPAGALGEDEAFDLYADHALWAAMHPDLPAATVDFRYPSRAVQIDVPADTTPTNPAARQTVFDGQPVWWRQVNPHGVPCFPGSYEDVSRRTVDLRTPDWRQGHVHAKRVILHVPPPPGFFETDHQKDNLDLSTDQEHILEDRTVNGTLTLSAGKATLRRCAVRTLTVTLPADGMELPMLTAEDCLFGELTVPGLARLEYCTVLDNIECGRLQASDSLFAGVLKLHSATLSKPHCIRFSRIPPAMSCAGLLAYRTVSVQPVFHEFMSDDADGPKRRPFQFGERGCAVLHPATSEAIRFGAEDGGEMGVCHRWRYSLLMAAVLDKLKDFLPLGVEVVLTPDSRLLQLPFAPCPPAPGS